MNDKYYLVSYQWKTSAGNWIPDNLTLQSKHPTEWLYEQLEERKREVILNFYSEITQEQHSKLSEWI